MPAYFPCARCGMPFSSGIARHRHQKHCTAVARSAPSSVQPGVSDEADRGAAAVRGSAAAAPTPEKTTTAGGNPTAVEERSGLTTAKEVSLMGAPATTTAVLTWTLEQASDVQVGERFWFSDEEPDVGTALVATSVDVGPHSVRIGVHRPDGTKGEWGMPTGTLVYVLDEKSAVAS